MTDKPTSTPADETRGLAFASYSVMNALLSVLERKGLLTSQDVQDVLHTSLTGLEHRPQDNAIDIARRLVEGNAINRAASRPKGPLE